MTINNQFKKFEKDIIASGMTFDPSIDCRNDLVNFYGYTRQQVENMSDDQLFYIMDQIENQEKGYVEVEESFDNGEYDQCLDYDDDDILQDMIIRVDDACYNKAFKKANELVKETYDKIMGSNVEKQYYLDKLNKYINRYNLKLN